MSWSETKLLMDAHDEIFEKVKKGDRKNEGTKYAYNSLKTEAQTPLSVTGKGRFYWMEVKAYVPKSATTVVTIIIDGRTVLTANLKNGYSDDVGQSCFVHNESKVVGMEGYYSSYFHPASAGACLSYSSTATGMSFTEISEETTTMGTSAGNRGLQFLVNDYLEFNESLVIKVTNCSTKGNSEWYICYSLEEE